MEREMHHDMNGLRRTGSGSKFDVPFVRKMIPHHSSGVVEALEPQSKSTHPQLRAAATTGITNQQAEIADFRTWLSAHG